MSGVANWSTGSVNRRPEPATGPSQTQPNQTRPLKEIVDRFIRGDGTEVFKGTFDENFPPGLENLTELERLQMSREIDEGVAEIRSRVGKRNYVKYTLEEKAARAREAAKAPEKSSTVPVEGGTTE